MDVATTIRTARERKGWSQEQLAHHAGVSFRTVSRYETGRAKQHDEETLGRICFHLGIPFTPSIPARIGEEAA